MAKNDPEQTVTRAHLQQMITFRVSRLHARLNAQANRILKESSDLSLMQWRVFVTLETMGKITPSEIIRQTNLDKGQLSRAIKSMLDRGLISSETCESDQRAHYIDFTPKGLEHFNRARPHMRARQERLMGSLTPDEQRELFNALQKLDAVVDEMDGKE
jgi:DNA-binding MarR family transcriptional regulator